MELVAILTLQVHLRKNQGKVFRRNHLIRLAESTFLKKDRFLLLCLSNQIYCSKKHSPQLLTKVLRGIEDADPSNLNHKLNDLDSFYLIMFTSLYSKNTLSILLIFKRLHHKNCLVDSLVLIRIFIELKK